MSLLRMVFSSLRQHVFSTFVTAVSIALAGGLLMSVWTIKEQARLTFEQVDMGFDAVLGARGSKLQLVLNAIFHMEASPGNLKWEDYEDIKAHPSVDFALPLALGDNYRGFRIVGTATNIFEEVDFGDGRPLEIELGRTFDDGFQEAVIGSYVADRLGLTFGDEFHPYHGLIFDEKEQHSETYLITGVARPTNTPADKVIWIPVEGVQKMTGHDPKAASDLSAVLVRLSTPQAGFRMDMLYNKQGDRLTFAWPIGQIVGGLFNKIAWFDKLLQLIAVLVAFVATASVLASLYSSMSQRRRDIAILRALGAGRGTIFTTVVLESTAIATFGAVASFGVFWLILMIAKEIVRVQTGVILSLGSMNPSMVWTPIGLTLAGALAGIIPAIKAYRTEVASHLLPIS